MIYIDFSYRQSHGQATAVDYSNEEFIHHSRAARNMSTRKGKNASTYVGGIEHSWHLEYNQFISDLIDSNNGTVDSSRLIDDGSRLVTIASQAKELLDIGKPK